ncbi:Hypothetical protein FKW44_001516 [Caligus rogercresseyi]|uniref:Uncharacterized protein n=1 Tax=Caligus rogercresseyi TaxID=217165 RepID=A0A7T8QVN8_CALRO|nr:Hypothetical protein FKW44_001516 [Caligus rogercresseyi]
MALRVPPNTTRVFGVQFPANGPSGSAENNWGVLGLQIPRHIIIYVTRKYNNCVRRDARALGGGFCTPKTPPIGFGGIQGPIGGDL